jgi:hypothetical protein
MQKKKCRKMEYAKNKMKYAKKGMKKNELWKKNRKMRYAEKGIEKFKPQPNP